MEDFRDEAKHRKEVMEAYWKVEKDFDNSDEYDEYLMEVEDMVHALCHGENVSAVRQKLAEYKRTYGKHSALHRSRREEEYKQICDADELERIEAEKRRIEKLEAEKRRLAGLHSEKQSAQLNIAAGSADLSRVAAALAPTRSAPGATLERDLFIDPAALPAQMRASKQETQQTSSRIHSKISEAASIAAGCSQQA